MTRVKLSDLPPRLQKQALELMADDEERRNAILNGVDVTSKYHSHKTTVTLEDGTEHVFDSQKEAQTHAELLIRQKAGEIENLRLQVPYTLVPRQVLSDGKIERACKYYADFVYEENGKTVVVDVKSPATRTPAYRIKKKLMKYIHDIEIQEV